MRSRFLTADPLIWISVFFAKLSQRWNCRRIFALLHSHAEAKIVNTYTCASSFLCTSQLAVTTTLGVLDLRRISFHLSSSPLLLSMCIDWSSGINHEFSFFWRFWSGRRVCPGFNRRVKRSFVRILQLANIFRQVRAALRAYPSCCNFISRDLSSNLGAQGVRSWGSRLWMVPPDGPFLSRIIILHGARCLWRIWWRDPIAVEQIFSAGNLEKHNPIEYTCSVKQLIRLHHPSLPLCWASPPQHVENGTFCHNCILFLTCNSDTREDASNYMTDLRNFCFGSGICSFLPKDSVLCCLVFWRVFVRQSLPLRRVQEKTIGLFHSDSCICFQIQSHGWNYMSLLWHIVYLLSTESILPISTYALFPFRPLEVAPLSTICYGLWSFEFSSSDWHVASQTPSIFDNLAAHCFE